MPHLDEVRGLVGNGAPAASNGPTFRAHATTGTSLVANTAAKLNIAVVDWDTGGFFSSGRFQPTAAGYYQINGACETAFSTSYLIAIIAKNGVPQSYGGYVYIASRTAALIGHVSDIVFLNGAGDYVELWGQAGDSGTTGSSPANNYFSGCWVHA